MDSKTARKIRFQMINKHKWPPVMPRLRAVNYWRAVELTLKGLRRADERG